MVSVSRSGAQSQSQSQSHRFGRARRGVLAADERLCSHGYLASTRRARARAIVASKSAVRHRYCAIIRPSDCDAGGRGTRGAGTGSWLGRV